MKAVEKQLPTLTERTEGNTVATPSSPFDSWKIYGHAIRDYRSKKTVAAEVTGISLDSSGSSSGSEGCRMIKTGALAARSPYLDT